MTPLLYIFAGLGVISAILLFSMLLGHCCEALHIWQLKRNRVHDDLNRHEEEIKNLRTDIDRARERLCETQDEVEELRAEANSIVEPAAEEIPEAITITEVPPTDKFFLDKDGDVWKSVGPYLFLWEADPEKWIPASACWPDLFSCHKAVEIPAEHAVALTK